MPSSPQWLANPENQAKLRASRRKWNKANKAKIQAWKEANREHVNALYRNYYHKNKKRLIPYINAHRKGRLKDATPAWADKKAIRYFYVNCPEGCHVDHILPLHGTLVSGLHTLENLQYLSIAENLKKSNKVVESL